MTSPQDIRNRLEGYARAKVFSILQPMSEEMLVDQPGDPIDWMVRYLVENRSDLRTNIVNQTLQVVDDRGKQGLPLVDHPLLDKISELEKKILDGDKYRRKERKAAAAELAEAEAKIKHLEGRLVAAGFRADEKMDEELEAFYAWDAQILAASPPDPLDTDDFRFRNYTAMPPLTSHHRSVLGSLLEAEHFELLSELRTPFGVTLSKIIQPGLLQPDLAVGVAAGDPESYHVFGSLLVPVVAATHGLDPHAEGFKSMLYVPSGEEEELGGGVSGEDYEEGEGQLQAEAADGGGGGEEEAAAGVAAGAGKEVVLVSEGDAEVLEGAVREVRLQCWRNLAGRPFPAAAERAQRAEVEAAVAGALGALEGAEAGEYWALEELEPEEERELEGEGLALEKPRGDSLLVASGAAREWPQQRGVFYSGDKAVVVWCNAQEHVTLTVLQRGWDAGAALQRFLRVYRGLEAGLRARGLRVAVEAGLGFLGTSAELLGLAFRASLLVTLPTANRDPAPLHQVCEREALRLERHTAAAADAGEGDEEVWRVSSRRVYGVSEVEVVHGVLQGAVQLRHAAKELKGIPSR